MFYKILMALVILAAALLIVWAYNVNRLIQYQICSGQVVTELTDNCKEILNGKI